jgi:class 3 adenylate cyclase
MSGAGSNGYNILVVDPLTMHSSALLDELSARNVDVKQSWDLERVRVQLRNKLPDLIVMDPAAFGEEGYSFLGEIYEARPFASLPTLIVSEGLEHWRKRALFTYGICDFFEKPVDYLDLALRIRQLLDFRDSTRQVDALNAKLERERNILARYFSMDMVEKLLNEEISTDFGGSHLTVSTLVFDLRGSTALAESLDPVVFSEFLSELFTDVMDLIYGNHGSVNKLLGDGILATFGAPVPSGDDTFHAARTALQIFEYLETFNEFRPPFLSEPVQAGVGISTGEVFAGNVGSIRRMEYTVLGDAVNMAARLEKLTKEYGRNILVDRRTAEALAERATLTPVADEPLRGKAEAQQVYDLTAIATPPEDASATEA